MPLVAGRYELGQLLGSGGFASVFRAHDKVAVRDVALKVIPFSLGIGQEGGAGGAAALAGDGNLRADELEATGHFERFRHEALALSRLRSRHVARVFDFGRDAEMGLYLVMEYIDGVPLESKAVGRSLMPHEVLRVARGVLDALGDAHASGIVHRDIKPSNVLLPRGRRALDEVRVLDFGIARSVRRSEVDEALGKVDTEEGVVLGTPAYMAPEQLRRGEVGPAADVYSAGLMLFELLDVGPLFPGATLRDQIAARLSEDPQLLERVPPPLGLLLARMLARDPARRFGDGHEALAAIGDLETAPVVLDAIFAAAAPSEPTRRFGRKSASTPGASAIVDVDESESSSSQMRAGISVRPTAAFGGRRLCRLPHDGVAALRETLHALDLAMIDALARRERGSEIGRLARALSLALRLELDAASLIVEPLESKSALARAVGAAVIAPRARKVTRGRVENDSSDMWIDAIDPELAAMFSSLAVAMTTREDAARNEQRCRRALERLAGAHAAVGRTVHMAQIAAGCMAGTMPTSTGLVEMLRLRDGEREPPTAFNGLVRGLLLGVAGFRGDEHLARQQLERAARAAADTGNTLLEARAMVAWGGTLVEIPSRVDQGLSVLERATTLLAHGDAPSLEHIAEHNRGAALIIQGRYAEAAEHLSRARAAAKGELSSEHEMISCTNEAFAHIFLGRYDAARQALEELTDKRLSTISARSAAFAHVARSLHALLFQSLDVAFAELRRALSRAKDAEADAGDVTLLAELLGILYASARGEPVDLLPRAGELEKLAQDHGFASFYWMANLRSAVGQIRDDALRAVVEETLGRLTVMLEPMSEAAER